MSIIADDEIRDYEESIKNNGKKIEEFELTESTDPTPPLMVYTITGTVTIKCIKTNKSKTYVAGNNSCWNVEFDDDLKGGLFE